MFLCTHVGVMYHKAKLLENFMLQQQSWCEFIYLFDVLWGFSSLFVGYGSSHLPDLSLCKLFWLQSHVHWCSFTVSTNLLGEAHDWVHWLWVLELSLPTGRELISSAVYFLLPPHPFAFSEMKINFVSRVWCNCKSARRQTCREYGWDFHVLTCGCLLPNGKIDYLMKITIMFIYLIEREAVLRKAVKKVKSLCSF